MANPYEIAHNQSMEDPNGFWGTAAEDCHWYKKWDKVLDDSNKPFYRWFSGGETNTCYNALDYHIDNGRGEQNAMIYDSPVTDTIKKYTPGCSQGRSGPYLHAYDTRSGYCHAELHAYRGRTFSGFRRVCLQRTGGAY
jgi:hypothetical protein